MSADVAADWNARHPTGTPVLAWPGSRDGAYLTTVTRGRAWALGDGAAVVAVEGFVGGIALTHVAAIGEQVPPVLPPAELDRLTRSVELFGVGFVMVARLADGTLRSRAVQAPQVSLHHDVPDAEVGLHLDVPEAEAGL